nr:MAG: major coat protein [Plant associated polerovirus 1]UVK78409.1 MAG: major coat protein [Plant associated polerovirus 1]
MNTGAARNGRRRGWRVGRRIRRRNPVVVVQTPRQPQRRGRRRRVRRVVTGRGRTGRRGSSETFVFSKDNLKGSDSGSITFGPSLSDCPAFSSGILKAYHRYKITMVKLEFISEASSTSSGSIAYELDPNCEASSLQSYINKFGITKGGRRTFTASTINGTEWHSSNVDQFRILYKGNGSSSATAGSFRITIQCSTQNPK